MHRDFKGVWIPKEIWLSTELTLQEKVFLVEIDSLDNDEGCFASNKHFAEFFQMSKERARKIISELCNKGYITVDITYKDGTKEVEKRVIRVVKDSSKNPQGMVENDHTPMVENDHYNNTVLSNTVINKRDSARARFKPPSLQEVKDYAKSRSSPVDPQAFYDYFTEGNWQDSKSNKVKNWKQKFITWENMNGRNVTNQRPDRCLDKGQYDDLV